MGTTESKETITTPMHLGNYYDNIFKVPENTQEWHSIGGGGQKGYLKEVKSKLQQKG